MSLNSLFERKILLHFSAQICPNMGSLLLFFVWQWVLLRDCAHREGSQHYNFFQRPVYVHNQMYKCWLLITFENSSGVTKCSRVNACMCRLILAFAAREKSVMFLFQCRYLLLVSSAGNLFKQLAPRSGPVKLSCKNGAHVKSHMREECFFCFVFKRTFLSFNFHSYFIAPYEFSCRNALRLKKSPC